MLCIFEHDFAPDSLFSVVRGDSVKLVRAGKHQVWSCFYYFLMFLCLNSMLRYYNFWNFGVGGFSCERTNLLGLHQLHRRTLWVIKGAVGANLWSGIIELYCKNYWIRLLAHLTLLASVLLKLLLLHLDIQMDTLCCYGHMTLPCCSHMCRCLLYWQNQ